mgnify:CR=1 FL=1
MTQSQQLRKLAAQSATAFLVAALCAFPLYIDKFSNLGVVKFTAVCTLCWAFALWLGALRAVGAAPQPGRLPWRQDPALWALGAVTVSGVVSTALSLSPEASFWGAGRLLRRLHDGAVHGSGGIWRCAPLHRRAF